MSSVFGKIKKLIFLLEIMVFTYILKKILAKTTGMEGTYVVKTQSSHSQ